MISNKFCKSSKIFQKKFQRMLDVLDIPMSIYGGQVKPSSNATLFLMIGIIQKNWLNLLGDESKGCIYFCNKNGDHQGRQGIRKIES